MNVVLRTVVLATAGTAIASVSAEEQAEERLRALEHRIERLEQQKAAPENAEAQRKLLDWRSLRLGMSRDEVRELLGEPDRVEVVGGTLFFWYYYPVIGVVRFDHYNDRVESWSGPE